ncbi:DUF1189 family protein [Mycoplasmatota bacterium zrk1]
MFYTKIKNNILSPKSIYKRRKDSNIKVIGYILFLITLLLVPLLIYIVSFSGLTPGNQRMIREDLEDHLDINCELGDKLICQGDTLEEINFSNFSVVIDPEDKFVSEGFRFKLVFKEEYIALYPFEFEMARISYSELPTEWRNLNFDVDDEVFWEKLFSGLDQILLTSRSFWVPITIIVSVLVYGMLILFEILLNTFIIRIFRFGRASFKEIFTIITYSMTVYIIIRVVLSLYDIKISGMMLSFFQIIPLVYALIALRNAYRE